MSSVMRERVALKSSISFLCSGAASAPTKICANSDPLVILSKKRCPGAICA
ncbi:hypothetical protein PR003_g5364 [Phytophthora rubi]|uniref:Uncharacterized protein n=1 Tax=Phytophthora rubi TaxID=129364 RepID=A0A6A4FVL5_9STRA|nr:hypothetical protein PR003_g5364 [Phytophthora rubi]